MAGYVPDGFPSAKSRNDAPPSTVGLLTWKRGGPRAVTIAANYGANCGRKERSLPPSLCATGSACASGCGDVVPRIYFLRPGNVPVSGKPVHSYSASFATQLSSNKNSSAPFAPFLLRLPPLPIWLSSSAACYGNAMPPLGCLGAGRPARLRFIVLLWNCNAMKPPCELPSCSLGALDRSRVTFID